MRIHGYNAEKKNKLHSDTYIMAAIFGGCAAFILIFGVKSLIFLINIILKYWLWVLVVILVILFVKRYFLGRRPDG